jgi:hypothetical protein
MISMEFTRCQRDEFRVSEWELEVHLNSRSFTSQSLFSKSSTAVFSYRSSLCPFELQINTNTVYHQATRNRRLLVCDLSYSID